MIVYDVSHIGSLKFNKFTIFINNIYTVPSLITILV